MNRQQGTVFRRTLVGLSFSLAALGARPAGAQWNVSRAASVPPQQVVRLWTGDAPGAQGKEDSDIPALGVYLPPNPKPHMPAVVVCPGGGYRFLSFAGEGEPAQRYLNGLGIAVFVLKSRFGPKYHYPVELQDVLRAVRTVRARAGDWHVDPTRVGIMGFSAGGHLASMASTMFDTGNVKASDPIERVSSRPDFAVLAYAVITMTDPWRHQGSVDFLLGEHADSTLAQSVSTDRRVTANTPPTFLFHTNGDDAVPAENSVMYYLALRKAGVKAEIHVYQNGPHAVVLGGDDPVLSTWPPLLTNWLKVNGWLP